MYCWDGDSPQNRLHQHLGNTQFIRRMRLSVSCLYHVILWISFITAMAEKILMVMKQNQLKSKFDEWKRLVGREFQFYLIVREITSESVPRTIVWCKNRERHSVTATHSAHSTYMYRTCGVVCALVFLAEALKNKNRDPRVAAFSLIKCRRKNVVLIKKLYLYHAN